MTTLVNRPPPTRGGFTFVELVVVISVIVALSAIGFPVWGMISNRVKVNATDSLVQSIATAITTYQTKTWTFDANTTSALPAKPRMYHTFDLNHFTPSSLDSGSPDPQPDLLDAPVSKGGYLRFFSIDGYMPPEISPFYNASASFPKPVTAPYVLNPTKTDPQAVTNPDDYDVNFHLAVLQSGYRGFIAMAQPQIKKSFINKRGNVVDAWGRPLRIAFAAKVYGTQAFGVWSAGLDAIDNIEKDPNTAARLSDDDLRSWRTQGAN